MRTNVVWFFIFFQELSNEKINALGPKMTKIASRGSCLKSGKTDSQKPENYRGISLTCILSKVLEKIVHSQSCDHFQSSGTFSDSQYGFRCNHSCSDLLVSTIDDWLLARDRKLNTSIVFLDLTKAFDNVRHQISCSVYRMQALEVQFWDGYTTFSPDTHFSTNWPRWTPKGQQSTLHVQQRCPPGERSRTTLVQFLCVKPTRCSQGKKCFLSIICRLLYSLQLTTNYDRSGRCCNKCPPRHLHSTGRKVSDNIRGKNSNNDDCEFFFNQCSQSLMYLKERFTNQNGVSSNTPRSNWWWKSNLVSPHRCSSQTNLSKIGVLRRTMRQMTSPSPRQFLISVIQPNFEYAAVAFIPSMSMSGKQRLLALWRRAVCRAAMADWRADIAPLLVHLNINAIEHRWGCSLLC